MSPRPDGQYRLLLHQPFHNRCFQHAVFRFYRAVVLRMDSLSVSASAFRGPASPRRIPAQHSRLSPVVHRAKRIASSLLAALRPRRYFRAQLEQVVITSSKLSFRWSRTFSSLVLWRCVQPDVRSGWCGRPLSRSWSAKYAALPVVPDASRARSGRGEYDQIHIRRQIVNGAVGTEIRSGPHPVLSYCSTPLRPSR